MGANGNVPEDTPVPRNRKERSYTGVVTKYRIEKIDKLYWDPKERALGVHNLIENFLAKEFPEDGDDFPPTQWDKFCYAIEVMSQMAIVMENNQFLEIARAASHWLYSTHYSNAETIYGNPDRSSKRNDDQKSRTDDKQTDPT